MLKSNSPVRFLTESDRTAPTGVPLGLFDGKTDERFLWGNVCLLKTIFADRFAKKDKQILSDCPPAREQLLGQQATAAAVRSVQAENGSSP